MRRIRQGIGRTPSPADRDRLAEALYAPRWDADSWERALAAAPDDDGPPLHVYEEEADQHVERLRAELVLATAEPESPSEPSPEPEAQSAPESDTPPIEAELWITSLDAAHRARRVSANGNVSSEFRIILRGLVALGEAHRQGAHKTAEILLRPSVVDRVITDADFREQACQAGKELRAA